MLSLPSDRNLKTGGDPRSLADFVALREELGKLTHPARPDVDWQRVEQLSLALFRQNGVELQTTCWYTLARTRLAGISGLNEGLSIINALLIHQWGGLWPQPLHARMEILSALSQRLQSMLRTLTLHAADLPLIYEAEQCLNEMREVLQRLELKNASQIAELCTFMHNAATRLENADVRSGADSAVTLSPTATIQPVIPIAPTAEPLVYIAHQQAPAPRVVTQYSAKSMRQWRGFAAGVVMTLIFGGAALWGWQLWQRQNNPLPVLPRAASDDSLHELNQFSPLFLQHYGFALAARAEPAEAEPLRELWQQFITANALPSETLSGWHQGMAGLAELTRRLNALDERRGKYMTGSELKSMVFSITQAMERAVPLEEQLYQLSQHPADSPLPVGLISRTDRHLQQLLNRYMLIRQQYE